MMKTKDIIEGLQVLMHYYDDPDGFNSGAEHDEFYAYETDRSLGQKDLEKMISLGWHQEHDERDYGEDFSCEDYRKDQTWICYT